MERPTEKIVLQVGQQLHLQPMSEEEVRFELDMCTGCNRCMEVCPVPLSSQMQISALNQATIAPTIPAEIARFTQECVLCSSCVPVCPVNDHRDLLMLWLKQRVGKPWDDDINQHELANRLPKGWTLPGLIARLREQLLLRSPKIISERYLSHLIFEAHIRELKPQEILVAEGAFGQALYFLLDGDLELHSQAERNQTLMVGVMKRGEFLGEGMLIGQRYPWTARSQAKTVILEIPEQIVQRLLEAVPALREPLMQQGHTRVLETIMQRLPLFEGMKGNDLRSLIASMRVRHYERGQLLFGEQRSEQGEMLQILLDGFVKVARRTVAGDERIIAYRQAGDYFFGGLDMLGDQKSVSVGAMTRVKVAELTPHFLQLLFASYPAIKQRFQEQLKTYQDSVQAAYSAVFEPGLMVNKPINTHSVGEARAALHTLVGEGVIEGTDVLLIDLNRCIHCNECEDACASRHGHSRLNRKGLIVGNLNVTTACRHCQDPVCLLCSRAGIVRQASGEITITENCIGCGICAERCPYDTISIVDLLPEPGKKKHKAKALPMFSDPIAEIKKKIAVKCDLCSGYKDQACIQACPTGAVFRVDPISFFGTTDDILRKQTQ